MLKQVQHDGKTELLLKPHIHLNFITQIYWKRNERYVKAVCVNRIRPLTLMQTSILTYYNVVGCSTSYILKIKELI